MTPDSRLLHLPQSSRYAVSAALYLASRPAGGYHMVGDVAEGTALSPSYLSKILQRLALQGILESRRGAKGGYRLSRPPGKVSLSEIVAASHRLEASPTQCMIEAKDCDGARPCSMHHYVARAESSMWRRLDRTTLANLGGSFPKYKEP